MNRTIAASAVALALVSPASAGSNTNIDRELAGLLVMSFGVHNNCPAYELVDGGAVRFADARGANYDKIGIAAVNAITAIAGGDYDRSKLIPEVTRFVRDGMIELGGEITKFGKAKFCAKYGAVMENVGFMKKVDGKKASKKDDGSF
ncbi:hypothetical protein [Bradyrhizobium phage BDU-MI-1]|nr:hypothetical protein [Bradyrhizobium phage BDU-MI-1]